MRQLTLCLLVAFFPLLVRGQDTSQVGPSQVQPNDVHIKLLLTDDKKSFRIGDPISLTIEFTADRPLYYVDTIPDAEGATDTISVSPESGVAYWKREMTGGIIYAKDVIGRQDLSSSPIRVSLMLNDTIRFDTPGHYSVRVATERVSEKTGANFRLTTNEVEFEVKEMTQDQEKAEVARLTHLIEEKSSPQARQILAHEFSYLTGDASTREKARRFLQSEHGYEYAIGLYVARNRDLVLQLLENGLRDIDQPVDSSLLAVASQTRLLKERGPGPIEPKVRSVLELTPEKVDERRTEIENRYLDDLILNLSKRTGRSLLVTAKTILISVAKSDPNRSVKIADARRVVIQQFNSYSVDEQNRLLGSFWEDLRDTALVTALKQQLLNYSGGRSRFPSESLQRLIEISSEEARPFAVKAICEPTSFVDRSVITKLEYQELPEVDVCLSGQLKTFGRSSQPLDKYILESKAALAARFATDNIYKAVSEVYAENVGTLSIAGRATLLAYLAKHNESDAMPLITQALDQLKPEEDFSFLPRLVELYYSEAISDLLKKRLESDNPHLASNAAYLIGNYGRAGDETVLSARLTRWRNEWSNRRTEAEATQQGMIEREIIWALTNSKPWKLTEEKVKELRGGCVTAMCRTLRVSENSNQYRN